MVADSSPLNPFFYVSTKSGKVAKSISFSTIIFGLWEGVTPSRMAEWLGGVGTISPPPKLQRKLSSVCTGREEGPQTTLNFLVFQSFHFPSPMRNLCIGSQSKDVSPKPRVNLPRFFLVPFQRTL